MAKKNKQPENPNLKVKKYQLDKTERDRIQAIQSTIQILAILREGCDNSMYIAVANARRRLNLHTPEAMKAPEGWERTTDFDPNSYELLIIDQKIPDTVNASVPEASKPKN